MTAGKPGRNRRSAEQMLVELKRRLREISELNTAGDMPNCDRRQAVPARAAVNAQCEVGGAEGKIVSPLTTKADSMT
jgi:hypothetical protein